MSAVIDHADQCWVAMRWNGGHCVCGGSAHTDGRSEE